MRFFSKVRRSLSMMLPIVALTGLLAAGCGIPRHGTVYAEPAGGGRGQVYFPNSADNRGELTVALSDGEFCRGRYTTIPGPKVTYDEEQIDVILSEDTQDGMAVLDCKNGHLLRCNLSRDSGGEGTGQCTDNRGERLSMTF